jgi:hypothetical protein
MVNFEVWGITHAVYAITYSVFFSKVKCYCHTATNEARSSRTVVQKLLLEGNCRNECVKKSQNIFSSTAGNEIRGKGMWILFTKF